MSDCEGCDNPGCRRGGCQGRKPALAVHYRVIQELPISGIAPIGGRFSAWAQGETFACVSGVGLGPVRNSDIEIWLSSGMIVREVPLTAAQERDRMRSALSAATTTAETGEGPLAATAPGISRPWTLPGAEGGKI